MILKEIKVDFSICKTPDFSGIDLDAEYCFIGKTDEELSVVCPTEKAPQNALERSDGWRAFRIEGTLDFSLVGILAKISGILARAGIGIFAVSTYNTDYIFTRQADFPKASEVLANNGYEIA